ncbi:MAG: KfrB domain-containing protein [Burkholderiaceae bacterium]
MKQRQRIVVMNDQRIVQVEQAGDWTTQKVDRAGSLKPGIYNLHIAQQAQREKTYAGVIVHADGSHIYQQIGKVIVMHARSAFDDLPEVGSEKVVTYGAQGKATTTVQPPTSKRGRQRSFSG